MLGIDPGLASTGYGVVERSGSRLRAVKTGCIKTKASQSLAARLLLIYNEISEVIEETSPDAVALERIFFSKNVSSAFSVGQALGVCLLRASQADVPVFQYSPNEVKQAVSGYGKASKHQVQKMVAALLGAIDLPVSDHVSDALAVAICHINRAGNLLERLSDK